MTWGEIEELKPGIKITGVPTSLDKGKYVDLGIKRRDVTGDVTWTSGTTSVATVDQTTGRVTGVAAGTSIITASVAGTTYTAQCTITVVASKADSINDLIGKSVTYSANGVSDWKIFYADNSEMFIITTNILYSSGAGGSATSGLTTALPSNGIPINQSTVAGAMGTDTYGRKWNHDWLTYNVNNVTAVTTENRHKAVAYLCDTSKWDAYVAKTGTTPQIANSYAVGAPTLELFVASWNKVTTNKTISGVTQYGYPQTYSSGITSSIGKPTGETVGLYKPASSGYYWLASPYEGSSNSNYVRRVGCGGEGVYYDNYYDTDIGFRPLVSIPISNVQVDGCGNVSILTDAQVQQLQQ